MGAIYSFWELDVVVESRIYDGYAKSIKGKAVERHRQAIQVEMICLLLSSQGELRRKLTSERG